MKKVLTKKILPRYNMGVDRQENNIEKEGNDMMTYEERTKDNAYKISMFRMKQQLPYEAKVQYAASRVREFYDRMGGDVFVAVGGLDSITLLVFIRSLKLDVPAVSVSSLEDKSIQRVQKELGVERLRPALRPDGKPWRKVDIIRQFGYPVLSKEIASKIALLQHPTGQNATVRHAILTGETGEFGGNRTGSRMKLAQKWLDLFGGSDPDGAAMGYKAAPFLVSDKCCYYLKEKPCDDYAKKTGRYPYMGLMASEGGRRAKSLMLNGCNYYGKTTTRSAPFAIFSRQDVLQLALDLAVPVPDIYGEIVRDPDGTLRTTGAQRTGCSMCGFGIQMEKRPHRFDLLHARNPKEWDFWMNQCDTDVNGDPCGWGRVLDYIGVEWRQDDEGQMRRNKKGEKS